MGCRLSSAVPRIPDVAASAASIDNNGSHFSEMTKANFVSQVLESCSAEICLDDSRREFLEVHAKYTFALLRNKLKGLTRFRGTLLGRKGVGKSMLLSCFAKALRKICGMNLLVIEINALRDFLPRVALCNHLNISPDEDWKTLDSLLVERSIKVLFIVDEFNVVFHAKRADGTTFISDIQIIGEDSYGLYHCILCGSSTLLRRLISGKLSEDEAKHFANYSGIDMNGSKFVARTIVPFSTQRDLENLFQLLNKKFGPPDGQLDMEQIVVETGGFPSLLSQYWQTGTFPPDTCAIGLRQDVTPEQLTILESLANRVRQLMLLDTVSDDRSNEFFWVRTVECASVVPSCDVVQLYDLADNGYITLSGGGTEQRVGFYSARIYLEMLVRSSENSLTLADLVALSHPRDSYSARAECVVAQILMSPSSASFLSNYFGISHTADCKLEYRFAMPELNLPEQMTLSHVQVKTDRFLRESYGKSSKDAFGADFVFVEDSSKQVHRIQLKLGRTILKSSDFDTIARRFFDRQHDVQQAYGRVGLDLTHCRYYLLTTRQYRPEDGVEFENRGIKLIDAHALKSIWPEAVKNLGKPYK